MKRFDPNIAVGLVLILAGGLFALQTLGVLNNVGDLFWGGLFLAGGALFLFAFFTGSWWGAIPGCVLAGIGVAILLPDRIKQFEDVVVLGSIGLAFWLVYSTAPRLRWWALIPAGVLTTLAVVVFLPELLNIAGVATGSVFFFGLALTFLLVALLAGMRWAYIPALVLGVIGFLSMIAIGGLANYVWAVVLIVLGGYLIFRYFRPA